MTPVKTQISGHTEGDKKGWQVSEPLPTFFKDGQSRIMTEQQQNNPLHGKTLEMIVIYLQGEYGWDGLHSRIPVNCFKDNPSLKSSLKFLRRTPWAREKVETLYVNTYA